jgi:hypothetical protein
MEKILTPEEKKYLGKVSRYLNSLGIQYGELQFDLDGEESYLPEITSDEIPSVFNYNHMASVPDGLGPIILKIVNSLGNIDLYENLPSYVDYVNFQSYEIIIDSKRNEIAVVHNIGWTEEGPSEGVEYDDIIEEWEEKGIFNMIEIPEDNYLVLKYNGGGDSGYIESRFESGARNPYGELVPTEVENWCYQQLEENFGGWEINEGSQGEFQFDFNEKKVILQHTYNNDESKSNTLWEEEF